MLKIYLLENANDIGYDDWIGFVVAANTKKEAIELTYKPYYEDPKTKNMEVEGMKQMRWITKIVGSCSRRTPHIILSSFNAG